MSEAIQLALMLAPLSVYFYVLGLWQSSRRPKVVDGLLDYSMLVLGLSGFVIFGPAGRVLLGLLFGPANMVVWILWCGFVLLWAVFLGGNAGKRLIIYQVDEKALSDLLPAAVLRIPGQYRKTVKGFEDAESGRVLTIHSHQMLRTSSIQIDGPEGEATCRQLKRELVKEFSGVTPGGPTPVTWGLFFLSWVAMIAPMISLFINEPHMQSIVRQFFQRLQGGG